MKAWILVVMLTVLVGVPLPATAHVKWFVNDGLQQPASGGYFSLTEPAVQLWVLIILITITAAVLLDRFLPAPPRALMAMARRHRRPLIHLSQSLVGLALILTAIHGAILAPHQHEQGAWGLVLRFIEALVGISLITNLAVPLGAALLAGLFLASVALFGFVFSLEYFNLLGIALFLFLESIGDHHPLSRFKPHALPILRIHLGIALGVLAWTEKLIDPSLAIRFLETNQVNFMKALGVPLFNDRLFVLCAGCTELLFAVIFMLGLITRINTLTLAGFLISSNLYFFVIGQTDAALVELTGHLPLMAIALVLAVYGAGSRQRLTSVFSGETEAASHRPSERPELVYSA